MTPIDKKTSSRDALLRAAERLFTEKGYEAVSTRELAEAAGVNLGAIQYHFGSKAKLFVETIHHFMKGSGCSGGHMKLQREVESREDACVQLCEFVFEFLNYLLHSAEPQPCRMMFREIFTNTTQDPEMFEALTSSFAHEFMKPVDDMLIALLIHIVPEAPREKLEMFAQSVIGQCSFYVSHRPFITRLRGKDPAAPGNFEACVMHVQRFSLKALGCDDTLIAHAIDQAMSKQVDADRIAVGRR